MTTKTTKFLYGLAGLVFVLALIGAWQLWLLHGEIARVGEAALNPAAVSSSQIAREAGDDLTASVAKVTPAVVSVVITKNVPNLEIIYRNPFGSDPLYRDFGFRVPTYREKGTTPTKVGAGSGFVVSKDGYIATNKHVVDDSTASYTVLLSNGKQLEAKVAYEDQNSDIAILKVNASGLTPVSLGDSTNLKLGATVVAIGNALGEYSNSVSLGIISGLNRSIEASDPSGETTEVLTGVIQTDAAINPGNSGGPLIDLSGRVIGMSVATIVGSSNISFAIPVNVLKQVLQKASH